MSQGRVYRITRASEFWGNDKRERDSNGRPVPNKYPEVWAETFELEGKEGRFIRLNSLADLEWLRSTTRHSIEVSKGWKDGQVELRIMDHPRWLPMH